MTATENTQYVHTPVLLKETLELLSPEVNGTAACDTPLMIDSTLGEGGHSFAFLNRFPSLRIMGLDADAQIQKRARERLSVFGDRMSFYNGWFTDFYAQYPSSLARPDIILFDLGISVFHYECSGRGFSFRSDEKLDMRLNPEQEKSAADLVNGLNENELADVLFNFAQERYSRRIAKAIVLQRRCAPFITAKQLAECVYQAVPGAYRHGFIHPATKTFQALRIAVNGELDKLEQALSDAFAVLKTGGKMGVITFHSLEDKIVKRYFKDLEKHCTCPPEQPICKCGGKAKARSLTRKPVAADADEIQKNPPSRSAKLRCICKL
ncbi:16S rRNA (cytosine(1402)-N(4))-methyltransferase RsmH [Treponema lecithinolyticum]|uniref:16S rRNA (cytosine(1402)-N(4))-methyltransferase RsmH n=1 Tax=Treponema lecithinolyticum TaxID=53418 RepID=UPI0028F0A452|nr:16S rRNA (cytosine(1402)-N(4))-methyltransferase RsmH [Treponema lecithinolyticum]